MAALSLLLSISTPIAAIAGDVTPPISKEARVSEERRVSRRRTLCFGTCVLSSVLVSLSAGRPREALAVALDEFDQEEDRVVNIFQASSQSVVFIKDIELPKGSSNASNDNVLGEDDNTVVEGTGSGFIWDKYGHIVTNYHVIAKLASDQYGRQRCKVYLVDTRGNSISREAKLVGFDAAFDLAVLKVDVEGPELKPIVLGTSHDLRVGQSCFAIGNPYGYANTLTTGVKYG
uniref:Protease Do-like 5, chloroplastic n=1 Tax=Kalanchoe fedtschenkoi TaxID=63787 RepID=A0A7N0VH80_KALFE